MVDCGVEHGHGQRHFLTDCCSTCGPIKLIFLLPKKALILPPKALYVAYPAIHIPAVAATRLGNKLTGKHIHYHKNKMKVNLATQLMSDSVSRSLKLLHNEQWPGFESPDVLVTCRFIELHDQLFDILNSRSRFAYGTKAALTPSNIEQAEIVFSQFIYLL